MVPWYLVDPVSEHGVKLERKTGQQLRAFGWLNTHTISKGIYTIAHVVKLYLLTIINSLHIAYPVETFPDYSHVMQHSASVNMHRYSWQMNVTFAEATTSAAPLEPRIPGMLEIRTTQHRHSVEIFRRNGIFQTSKQHEYC